MEALVRFAEVIQNRHCYAQRWKEERGGKVVGYLCTYVPEEFIYAAGALPVRIMGSHKPQDLDVTEMHVFSMYCPFSRDCLAQGLLGRYDYLDGIVHAHSCLHIRQTFDSWQRHVPVPFSHYLYMPAHVVSRHALPYLTGELAKFRRSLEAWLGSPIPEEGLERAIEVYNTNRRLLRELYERRKGEAPSLSGAETMEVVLASMLMDKEEHNRLLEELLVELPLKGQGDRTGPRLMLIGSECDDTEVVKLIESLGGRVVVDDLCVGTRYFWNEVTPQGDKPFDKAQDRLEAIARRYLEKPLCPVKDLKGWQHHPYLLQMAQEYRVQGVIGLIMKFCEPHLHDLPPLWDLFSAHGLPALFLDTDITLPLGQFRTRIEAFLEILQGEGR